MGISGQYGVFSALGFGLGYNLLLALYLPCTYFDHQRKFLEIRLRTGTLAHQNCDLGCFFSTGYSKRVFHISIADWTFALSFGFYLLCPYNLALSTRSFESLKFKKAADCTFSVFIINSKTCCICETRLDLCNKEAGRGKGGAPSNVMQKLFSHQSGNAKTEI